MDLVRPVGSGPVLHLINISGVASQAPRLQCSDNSLFINHASACRINKKCSFGHFGELFSAEEMLRFGRKRECTHKKGRRRDQLVKFKRLYVQSDLIGFVQGLTIPVRHNGAEGT